MHSVHIGWKTYLHRVKVHAFVQVCMCKIEHWLTQICLCRAVVRSMMSGTNELVYETKEINLTSKDGDAHSTAILRM